MKQRMKMNMVDIILIIIVTRENVRTFRNLGRFRMLLHFDFDPNKVGACIEMINSSKKMPNSIVGR